MSNPYLDRRAKRQSPGIRAEKAAARRLNGRAQPGSGAMPGVKGDIKDKEFLMESKSTAADSLSVKKAWLDKIAKEALDVARDPALIVQFTETNGALRKGGSWVMVPEALFKELVACRASSPS